MSEEEYLKLLAGVQEPAIDGYPQGCDGKGSYLTSRDAHRSAGWVPCWCARCTKYRAALNGGTPDAT